MKPNRPGRQPQNQIANTNGKTCLVLRCEKFTILLSKYFLENSLRLVGTYIGQRFVIGNYNVPFKVWKSSRTKRMRNDCPKRLTQSFKTVHLLCILHNLQISWPTFQLLLLSSRISKVWYDKIETAILLMRPCSMIYCWNVSIAPFT